MAEQQGGPEQKGGEPKLRDFERVGLYYCDDRISRLEGSRGRDIVDMIDCS